MKKRTFAQNIISDIIRKKLEGSIFQDYSEGHSDYSDSYDDYSDSNSGWT